jgi:hypothetical protein
MTIKTYYDPALAEEHLQISPDLDKELTEVAGKYSYWNAMLAHAEMQLERLENLLELVEAKLDESIRKDAATTGAKITEGQIKSAITRNEKVIQVKGFVAQARCEMNLLKAQSYALVQRKDALLQLARRRTEEMKGSPTTHGHRSGMSRADMEASVRDTLYPD